MTNQRHCGRPGLCKFHTEVDVFLLHFLHRDHASAVCICVQFHAIVEDGDGLEIDVETGIKCRKEDLTYELRLHLVHNPGHGVEQAKRKYFISSNQL